MQDKSLPRGAERLIAEAGFAGEITAINLTGGANNRAFRIDADGSSFLLKAYFHHRNDPHNRLEAEYNFSEFAWGAGIRCLPRPVACDRQNHLGLYAYIQGRRLQPGEVEGGAVEQALNFFLGLNHSGIRERAKVLPPASEACFSFAKHLKTVEERVKRLKEIEDSSEIDHACLRFVRKELSPEWERVKNLALERAPDSDVEPDGELSLADRCISPSDFGFHNAILAENGSLYFIDFEYAGWDDPAKMSADFFNQPAVPVPAEYYGMFTNAVAAKIAEPEKFINRTNLLRPVYRLKWCCILLNDFLPLGGKRRIFADSTAGEDERKYVQLSKARELLEIIDEAIVNGIM